MDARNAWHLGKKRMDHASADDRDRRLWLHARDDLLEQLSTLTQSLYVQGITSIYDHVRASNKVPRMILNEFQSALRDVTQWSNDMIANEYVRFKLITRFDRMDALVRAIARTHASARTAARRNNDVDVVPSDHMHKTYIRIAREIWKRPFLLYHALPPMEYQRNLLEVEAIVRRCIASAFNDVLPDDVDYETYTMTAPEFDIVEDDNGHACTPPPQQELSDEAEDESVIEEYVTSAPSSPVPDIPVEDGAVLEPQAVAEDSTGDDDGCDDVCSDLQLHEADRETVGDSIPETVGAYDASSPPTAPLSPESSAHEVQESPVVDMQPVESASSPVPCDLESDDDAKTEDGVPVLVPKYVTDDHKGEEEGAPLASDVRSVVSSIDDPQIASDREDDDDDEQDTDIEAQRDVRVVTIQTDDTTKALRRQMKQLLMGGAIDDVNVALAVTSAQ
jgi:hypothetical protein